MVLDEEPAPTPAPALALGGLARPGAPSAPGVQASKPGDASKPQMQAAPTPPVSHAGTPLSRPPGAVLPWPSPRPIAAVPSSQWLSTRVENNNKDSFYSGIRTIEYGANIVMHRQ